jgi:hypothetical protein
VTTELWTAVIFGPIGLALIGVAALDIDFRDGSRFDLENIIRDTVGRAGLQVFRALVGIACGVFALSLALGLVTFPPGWDPPPR